MWSNFFHIWKLIQIDIVVQVIIQLGNDILNNLGVEEPIDDVGVFFSDEFYIQFFQAAFPEIDFSQLTAG